MKRLKLTISVSADDGIIEFIRKTYEASLTPCCEHHAEHPLLKLVSFIAMQGITSALESTMGKPIPIGTEYPLGFEFLEKASGDKMTVFVNIPENFETVELH